MKKTATITWVKYTNYGTLLQAYALQQYIKGIGYNNKILSDENIVEPYETTFKVRMLNVFCAYIKRLLCIDSANKRKCTAMCQKFKLTYLDIDYNTSDLYLVDSAYDIFICGSDQVWNPGPSYYKHLNNSFYYAGFTRKPRIAYAPSLGVSEYPEKHKAEFISYIKDFKSLSAREDIGCDIIQSLIGKNTCLVVDPVLLLSEKQWRELIGHKQDKEKYVLTYFLTPNELYINTAKKFAAKNGLKLKMIYLSQTKRTDEYIICGPIEFLQAICRASYVFTDSFHGTLFSIMLETKFVTFKRFKKEHKEQNERLINLYRMMDIKMKMVDENNIDDIDYFMNFNFQAAKDSLDLYIRASKEYLSNALKID